MNQQAVEIFDFLLKKNTVKEILEGVGISDAYYYMIRKDKRTISNRTLTRLIEFAEIKGYKPNKELTNPNNDVNNNNNNNTNSFVSIERYEKLKTYAKSNRELIDKQNEIIQQLQKEMKSLKEKLQSMNEAKGKKDNYIEETVDLGGFGKCLIDDDEVILKELELGLD